MTAVMTNTAVAGRPAIPATRDLAVDFARVLSVVVVVTTHMLMVGVGMKDGQIVVTEPLTPQPWFPVATLFLQIMPLFFILGGFSSLTSWRSLQKRGGTAADYVRNRVIRLARPAIPVFILFAVAVNGALLAGVDPGFLTGIVVGIGTPLWFVAAYILCQWFVPVMARFHETARWKTLAVLAAGAVVVDALRYATGVEEIGLLNLVFVWLFVQQLGFLYADGWFFQIGRRAVAGIGVAAVAVLAGIIVGGLYVADMLHNLNPPTVPLALLGIAQISLVVLLHPTLTRLMQKKPAQVFTFLFGSRLMTIYLWHMTALVAVTGVSLLIPGAAPEPATEGWWWSRPVILLLTFAGVFLLSKAVIRFENGAVPVRAADEDVTWVNATAAALLVFLPAFYIMRYGLDGYVSVAGAICFTSALFLVRPRS